MTRRSPSQYDLRKLQVDETILPSRPQRFTSPRRKKIKHVVAHHMTIVGRGDGRANDACLAVWRNREASAHYGVDGKYIRQFVWDSDASWATANTDGNHAGISIEHANSSAGPNWGISETTWKTGAMLAAYLHLAYGLGRPVSKNSGKGGTLRKHSSFFATACPGPTFDRLWGQYVAEAQRVYDQIAKGVETPKPIPIIRPNPKPKPQLARYFAHAHLNTWGDSDEGARTFLKRLPGMVRDLVRYTPEVITLNEVRDGQRDDWRAALKPHGYRVILAAYGNLIAVRNSAVTEVERVHSFRLPNSAQGEGRDEVTGEARIKVNGHWQHIVTAHLDYRSKSTEGHKNRTSGWWDRRRALQGRVGVLEVAERFAKRYKLPTWKTRTSIGGDFNSHNYVRQQVFEPAGFDAVVSDGLDQIYSARKALDTEVIKTDSDHKIIIVTYGKAVA